MPKFILQLALGRCHFVCPFFLEPPLLFYFYFFLQLGSGEAGSLVFQADLELATQLRMTLNKSDLLVPLKGWDYWLAPTPRFCGTEDPIQDFRHVGKHCTI